MQTKFEFLQAGYPEIYQNVLSALENKVIEPDITIYKIRKSLESLLKEIGKEENIILGDKLYININILYKQGIIDSRMNDICNYIREKGNIGVHNNIGSMDVAEDILQAFYVFSKWFGEKYLNYSEDNNYTNQLEDRYSSGLQGYDKEIYDTVQSLLETMIEESIVKDNKVSFITEVKYITFDEYYDYYLEALNKIVGYTDDVQSGIPVSALHLVLEYKKIAKRHFFTDDDIKINRMLARELYMHTHWRLLQKG